ncbi:hypothetical protein Bpfe_030492 [Biomphalaria pfeifferi]|uniref:Uncharacterized protein n=1 Tax=Biomphalaria pfeifferi TaxID=112525 RepID=A0AAD8APJ7_BIOPF|nr:hypothetical protein Bpfe_030492 [Biomphalaria pfeifferi]
MPQSSPCQQANPNLKRNNPIQQPATHKNCNHPARKPRHNQNNRAYRDCNNSMRSHKPNRQKQQVPQTISVVTAVPKPSVTNQQIRTDRTAGDPYVVLTLTVAPESTALGLTKTEVISLLPQPVSSPPGIETILVNGRYVRSLFNRGCALSWNRMYYFILSSRYVPIGAVNKPLPVGRKTKQKRGINQPVGSPSRHPNKPSADIDHVRKTRGKLIYRTHEEAPHYGFRDKSQRTHSTWALRHNIPPNYWSAPRGRCNQSYFPRSSRLPHPRDNPPKDRT